MELGSFGKKAKDIAKKITDGPTAFDVLGNKVRGTFDEAAQGLKLDPEDGTTTLYKDPRIAAEAKNKKQAPAQRSRFLDLADSDHNQR